LNYFSINLYKQHTDTKMSTNTDTQFEENILTPIRAAYRKMLLTDRGKEILKDAVDIKRAWRASKADATVSTAYVKMELLPLAVQLKTTLLTINPIGLNNMCHINADMVMNASGGEVKSRIGYNITACPCGKLVCFELHSVNKIRGKLFDITRDFNDEPSKYFLELDTTNTARGHIGVFGKDPFYINKGCQCGIHWVNGGECSTEEELMDKITSAERMKIWGV